MGKLLGGLVGGNKKMSLGLVSDALRSKSGATAPGQPAGGVMPTPDDEAVSAARRRRLAQMQNRGGRQSTILSNNETLGGG